MFQGALIHFGKTVSLKKLLQKWLDKVNSCAQNVSPKTNMDCP